MEATTEGDPIRWRADELLAQAGWLGLLARRLVADPNAADDVVQDTWIAALRRPPERERELRPWLAKVARNVARMQRRGESSRKAREGSHADESDIPSPDELAARLEGQRLLVAALGELDEPYRSTILLAYFEHLTSEQIAARFGLAAGTVRWRIKVGLDQLRERLDRRHDGDRGAWSLAWLPLVRSESGAAVVASATALSLQGALIMQTLLKVGGAAAAVVIVAGVLVYSGAVPQFSLRAREEAPLAVTFRPIELPREVPTDPAAAGERVATPEGAALGAVAPASEAEPISAAIDARFLAAEGGPLAGVAFSTQPRSTSHHVSAVTGADGRASLRVELDQREGPISVVGKAPGRATWTHTAQGVRGVTVHVGDVVLAPGGNIAGRVIDRDGAPVAGVAVGLDRSKTPRSESENRRRFPFNPMRTMRAETDADGRFTLEGVGVGFVCVAAGGSGWLTTFSAPVEVVAGQVTEGVELVLEPVPSDELISGLVVDPAGRPSPYARVSYSYHSFGGSGDGSLTADERGVFRFVAMDRAAHELDAFDEGGVFGGAHASDVEPGTRDLVLRLRALPKLAVVVRTREGAPIEDFTALAYDPEGAPADSNSGPGPHAGGRVELAPPTARFTVRVDALNYELGLQGPFEGAVPTQLEFVLAPAPSVSGRVLVEGNGFSGAKLAAFRCDNGRFEHNGFRVRCDPQAIVSTTTDARGEFALMLREKGRYLLRVSADGFAASEIGPLDVDPAIGARDLIGRLSSGGRIEGRVLVDAGRSPAGSVIAFSRGDGFAFTRRADEAGAFWAEHLTPGRWHVLAAENDIPSTTYSMRTWPRGAWDEIPSNCAVVEGGATRFDLDLTNGTRGPVELHGHLTIDGAAPGAWSVTFIGSDLHAAIDSSAAQQLDGQGRFVLHTTETSERRLLLTALGGPLDGLRIIQPVALRDGANEWSLDLRSARVAVENVVIADPRTDQIGLVWIGERGAFALRPILSAGSSEFAMPAGLVKLWRLDENALDSDPRSWRALAEGTLVAGERITLRAP
jgi:RNA polymerase sigma-70 factor (ECF subfamily)